MPDGPLQLVWLETAGRHLTPLPYLTAQANFLTGDGPPADRHPRSDRLQQWGRPTPFVAQVTVRCGKYGKNQVVMATHLLLVKGPDRENLTEYSQGGPGTLVQSLL